MKNKTVLITGSTSGIGLGIAESFAEKGYNIVFNGLEKDGIEISQNISNKYNIEHLFFPANMLYPEQLREMVKLSVEKFGVIDILINNAGIQHVSPIEEFPEDKWDNIIAINLTSAFHLIKAVWKEMKSQNFGRIINIASAHGLFASEYKSAYVSAKHGIIGLTKTVALEGSPFNITCNAICPGYVKTPLVDMQILDQAKHHNLSPEKVISEIILKKQSVKEFVPIKLIADMALLLVSENSTTLTGSVIPIDGGWSAQ
ncbi:MAG: 3-hydroxybutyrate dehydrogenase [Candidatus Sericytochromatia bacterium]|nr:3-hydroxybutyrate dehydrogenase [Candidatus Sericytochromatia bacterium]